MRSYSPTLYAKRHTIEYLTIIEYVITLPTHCRYNARSVIRYSDMMKYSLVVTGRERIPSILIILAKGNATAGLGRLAL